MENPGQRYAPLVENPPEPPLRHRDDDDLIEVELDSMVSEKLALVWQKRRILGKWIAWGVAVALILWLILPRRYESTVRLMPPEMSNSGSILGLLLGGATSGASSSAAGLAASIVGAKTAGDLYVDILSGPVVLDPIINKFDLRKEYHEKYYEFARKDLIDRTVIDTNRKSGVITISVTASSPWLAQSMAQAYADQLDSVVRQVSSSSAHRERVFLETRLKVVKAELDDASQKLATFASKNVALDIPEQAKASLTAAARGQAELIAAQSELEGLRQIFTDNNFRVKAIEARIGELRRNVDMQQTNSSPGSMMDWIRKLPQLGVEWSNYYRTATLDELVYEALIKQYELAKVQEAKETTPVVILDPPLQPERKSYPKGSIFLLVGLFLSTLGGMAYIIGSDAYQRVDPDHPAKMYIEETRARWIVRWRNNKLRMRAADRTVKRPEDNGSAS